MRAQLCSELPTAPLRMHARMHVCGQVTELATRLDRLEKQQDLVLNAVLRIKSMLEATSAGGGGGVDGFSGMANQGVNDHMVGQMAAAFGANERPNTHGRAA